MPCVLECQADTLQRVTTLFKSGAANRIRLPAIQNSRKQRYNQAPTDRHDKY